MYIHKKVKVIQILLLVLLILPLNTYAVSTIYNPYPDGQSCSFLSSTDLGTSMAFGVDSRIQGLSGSNALNKDLWTSRGNSSGGWIRSISTWTTKGSSTLNFTGVSPWNSNGNYTQVGTLISPRHIILAKHFTYPNGTQLIFVDSNNNIITRTLIGQKSVDSGSAYDDIQIGLLDSDVPSTVTFYPIVPISQYKEKWKSVIGTPMILLDQQDRALVADIMTVNDRVSITNTAQSSRGSVTFNISNNTTRASFYETLIEGDSGDASFLVIGDKLVLVLAHFTPTGAQFHSYWNDLIDQAMSTLDSENSVLSNYQTSTIDLSCFDAQSTSIVSFASSTYSFLVNENSATGTSVGQAILLQGINQFFQISTTTPTQLFSISSSTGNIIVNSSNINYEVNSSHVLKINSLSNDWFWPSINASTTVIINITDVNEAPIFTSSSSFIFDESILNNASVGTVSATDPDIGSVLSYSIESGNDGLFAIGSSTGVITIANKNLIDYDSKSSYSLVIKALDNGSPSQFSTTTLTIFISPVNHPKISFNYSSVNVNDNIGVLNIPFTLSSTYGKDVTVNFGSLNGTANIGSEFSLASSTVTILTGQTTGVLPINIVSKNSISSDKIFFVTMVSSDRGVLGTTTMTQVTIKNIVSQPVSSGGGGGGSPTSSVFSNNNTLNTNNATMTNQIVNSSLVLNNLINLKNITGFKIGDRGIKVLELQKMLVKEKLLSSINTTGYFGILTQAAVQKYNTGLKIVNIFNPINPKKIFFTRNLSLNMKNDDVKNLQKYLNSKSFLIASKGPGSPGNETSVFGKATRSALIKLQLSLSIPASGIFDLATRNALN